MSFSDEELTKRLRNMATDHELAGQYVTAKVLAEAAARIMGLANLGPEWHPSLTTNGAKGQVLEFKVKNPFEGEF
jgi:hypothetical protein